MQNEIDGYKEVQAEIERKRIADRDKLPEMTERQKRLHAKGILGADEVPQELTPLQKEYRTKIWPKHYIPSVREYKAKKFDEIGEKLELKIGGIKQGKRTYIDLGPEIKSGPLDDDRDLFVMCSANDWMPIRMKSKRDLTFEKMNPDEPIPKSCFVLDNHIKMYSNFFAPGYHFFYFVWDDGKIFLSPNYDVCRFKNTNIFLNRIYVHPSIEDFKAVHQVKGVEDEEAVFMKDRSVFREYKDENKVFLKKCFEEDMQFSKVLRFIKGDME